MRFPFVVFVFICVVAITIPLLAQSPNGNINGLVSDQTNAAVAGADIVAVNDVTRVQYTAKTNNEGIYVLTNLPPGPYRIEVSKIGFKTLIKPDIVLNVQDSLSINFALLVGAFHEIVTVEGGAPLVNAESTSVSTVVDHTYVENMPLNGRSFQDLILLTPGVVPASPQGSSSIGYNGEFSVNGQRTESNYYSVDGVSANVSAAYGLPSLGSSASASGSLPASTALGTTQGLVSIDALQEFRVHSSSYSAEFGRNPGGQFSFVTRSGTNDLHGTAFEYLRNNVFDANDWFNNYYGVTQPPLRQSDFGGTLGGPVRIPYWYNGKDRTFIFFSYEGLRLVQPQAATVNYVPDLGLRELAPIALRPVLNAFPLPNGPDLGNGLAQFVGSWSNPSQIDSTSVRIDHVINDKLRLFFRYSYTPSNQVTRLTGSFSSPATRNGNVFKMATYTLGITSFLSSRLANEFRANYSSNRTGSTFQLDGFGGGTPVSLAQLQGLKDTKAESLVGLLFAGYYPELTEGSVSGRQKQWNFVDTLNASVGLHLLKWGVDYRRLPFSGSQPQLAYYIYSDQASVLTNNAFAIAADYLNARPVYANFSAFLQDTWRVNQRLTLSMGVRWEVNPAPTASDGKVPYTVVGASNLTNMTLAPQGTSLWKTTWLNFAPRLGVAYMLRNKSGWETVLHGGGGVFFDTGQQLGSAGYQGVGFAGQSFVAAGAFPLSPDQLTPSIVNPPVPPYTAAGGVYAYSAHLQLPYTLHWNVSLAQSLRKTQALTVSYVGAHASRLLQENKVHVQTVNPNFGDVLFIRNGLTSDYDALQLQFQRRLASGLQALASYGWSHSIDYASTNASLAYRRGNSDFDVRHNFSGALSYDWKHLFKNTLLRSLGQGWGIDGRFTARTGFPVALNGNALLDSASGNYYYAGLDIVPGQPIYIRGSECAAVYNNTRACPGGRAINPSAFTLPISGEGDAPRNFVRGFGAWQMDIAVRREVLIHDRLKFQFRGEVFNLLNHPNLGAINATYCPPGNGCTFGQATASLAQSSGILSPLYQTGGPRSVQFALKLLF